MASELDGVAELTAQLTALGAQVAARELKGAVKDAIEPAEHLARQLIPVGTEPHKTYKGRIVAPGYALSTLHVETKVDKSKGTATASLGVGKEAFYATIFVELGTSKKGAQPWLRPAFEQSQSPMLQSLAGELRRRVNKIARRRQRAAARRRR
jgi:HK97 gp10 family phage protein